MSGLLEHALYYAKRGWKVFPCTHVNPDGTCSCGNPECKRIAKHPVGSLVPNGCKDATLDPDQIRAWWGSHGWNIGISTGVESNLVVVDIDDPKGWNEVKKNVNVPSDTVIVRTGSGGTHLYFQANGNRVSNSQSAIAPGVDIRGEGGYVIAPPSVHASGKLYEFLSRSDAELADFPAALLVRTKKTAPPSGNCEAVVEGGRDSFLFSVGIANRRNGAKRELISQVLHTINQERCRPPLSAAEVDRIVAHVAEDYQPYDDFEPTRQGMGILLARQTNAFLRWRSDAQLHIVYDPVRNVWATDRDRVAAYHALEDCIHTLDLQKREDMPEERMALIDALKKDLLKSEGKHTRIIDYAKRHMSIDSNVLNHDPHVLNCPNGLVDLRSGKLLPHDPLQYCTKVTNEIFDPNASSDLYSETCRLVLGPDEEQFWIMMGSMIFGTLQDKAFYVLQGTTNSGKSSLITPISRFLGTYYAKIRVHDILLDVMSNHDSFNELEGARLAVLEEWPASGRIDVNRIKEMTGESTMKVRPIKEAAYDIRITATLLIQTNHVPTAGADRAFLDRMRLSMISRAIPDDVKNPDAYAELANNPLHWRAAGARLIWGAREWWKMKQAGERRPPVVFQAPINETVMDQNPLSMIFDTDLELNEKGTVDVAELMSLWTTRYSHRTMVMSTFKDMLDTLLSAKHPGEERLGRKNGRWTIFGYSKKSQTNEDRF